MHPIHERLNNHMIIRYVHANRNSLFFSYSSYDAKERWRETWLLAVIIDFRIFFFFSFLSVLSHSVIAAWKSASRALRRRDLIEPANVARIICAHYSGRSSTVWATRTAEDSRRLFVNGTLLRQSQVQRYALWTNKRLFVNQCYIIFYRPFCRCFLRQSRGAYQIRGLLWQIPCTIIAISVLVEVSGQHLDSKYSINETKKYECLYSFVADASNQPIVRQNHRPVLAVSWCARFCWDNSQQIQ